MKQLFLALNLLAGLAVVNVSGQTLFTNALDFNGASQHVTVPTAGASAISNTFTIEAWVYVRAYASWARLIDFGDGQANNNILFAVSAGTSGQPQLEFYNAGGSSLGHVLSPSAVPLNTWTHLACTYDGTNGSIYINGNLAVSGAMPAPPNVTRTSNYIARSNWGGGAYANAIYDEFRIWSVARSGAQIQAGRGTPLVGNEANLLLYYRFDSASGTVATNSATATGAAYNGTLVNSPAWVGAGVWVVTNNANLGAGSLRQAVLNATNGNCITFAPGLSAQTILLTNGEILLNKSLTIDGATLASQVTVNGNHASRVFHVQTNMTVVLSSLTLTNGFGSGIPGGAGRRLCLRAQGRPRSFAPNPCPRNRFGRGNRT